MFKTLNPKLSSLLLSLACLLVSGVLLVIALVDRNWERGVTNGSPSNQGLYTICVFQVGCSRLHNPPSQVRFTRVGLGIAVGCIVTSLGTLAWTLARSSLPRRGTPGVSFVPKWPAVICTGFAAAAAGWAALGVLVYSTKKFCGG